MWGTVGERYYETGLDRGVLYVGANPGVPWIGLVSVNENSSGGEAKMYYIDGLKYLQYSASEEFEATVNAYSHPQEFAPCDGSVAIQNGLFATQQPRVPFGMSYRTRVGNDTQGPEHAYKIHLVYNALAEPAQRNNSSMGESVVPTLLSWPIVTMAPSMTGVKPTAHLVIDSRLTSPEVLEAVENVLYGDESSSAELPTFEELVAIFES
jgi:hypothetical protein